MTKEDAMDQIDNEQNGQKRHRQQIPRPTKEQDAFIRSEFKKIVQGKMSLQDLMLRYKKELDAAKTRSNWDDLAAIFNKVFSLSLTGAALAKAYTQLTKEEKAGH